MNAKFKPVVLIIMDGLGETDRLPESNSALIANTPTIDMIRNSYPTVYMQASEKLVGLPKGQMGNSEVGHMNIGAGRVVYQSLTLIDKDIEENTYKENEFFNKLIDNSLKNNKSLHILGCLSNGGVHSSLDHIIAFANYAKSKGVKVFIHAFTDGRDVDPKSSDQFIEKINKNNLDIASISGRYYAMDRDKRWERVQLAYDVLVEGKGASFLNPIDYVHQEWENNITDEFIVPAINSNFDGTIKDGDSVLFANFRQDRARELSHLLINSSIYDYEPKVRPSNLVFMTIREYDGFHCDVLYPKVELKGMIGEVLKKANKTQLRAAETEKYPHVTFFMDGGSDIEYDGETRILVNSPKVATYDLQPEMSAIELTQNILKKIDDVDVAIINFANPDMVGHTGSVSATAKAIETVDQQLSMIYERVEKLGGVILLTADHGNAERMKDEKGNPVTKHTTNFVRISITSNDIKIKDKFYTNPLVPKKFNLETNFENEPTAKLGDIAPTILYLAGVKKSEEMTGECLVVEE